MNISENTPKKNGKKKMKKFLLDKIGEREIGISAKKQQIKTTAKRSFLFFCSSLLIAIGTLCPMAIDVSADVPIITQVKTMAELIFTLTAGAGTVITQPTIVNPIISEFGSANYQMQNLVDNGAFNLYDKTTGEVLSISTEDAIDHIGDLDWLQENNAEFKMDYQTFSNQVSASNTLAKTGANLIHQAALQTGNPMEWDWGELIETYMNQGKLSYELLFTDYTTGNTIIQDMGNILDNIISFWTPNIQSSVGINTILDSQYVLGGKVYTLEYTYRNKLTSYVFYCSDDIELVFMRGSSSYIVYAHNYSDQTGHINRWYTSDGYTQNTSITVNSGVTTTANSTSTSVNDVVFSGLDTFTDKAGVDAYFASHNNFENNQTSPDLINPLLGNISYEDLQNLSPSIEQGQAIIPFDQSAYEDLMEDANENTNNNQPEDNPALVYPFIQDYILNDGQVDPNPNPDPETPSDPVPDQPTIPEKDPITDQEMQENLVGTTSGLEEIFPFCIPFDIVKLIKGLRAERKAPVIDWTFESDLFGFSYTFHIDLAEFNDVAVILRTMELIVFIIGLAVATRKLIGAGG